MRLFVFEYVTGGGMHDRPLPPALAFEADLMLRALLRELREVPIEFLSSRDARLPPLEGVEVLTPRPGEDPHALYARGLELVDAAWPTAPECDGILERLARSTLERGRRLLGCRPEAIALAASKRRTAEVLSRHGVPTVPTFMDPGAVPALPGPWVVKPDDGAGADGVRQVPDWRAARDCLAREPGRLVAQPWIEGEALSLSLLVEGGTVELLSCNRQRIGLVNDEVRLEAIEVNALPDPEGSWSTLGTGVAGAIPGLEGYVGVDLVAAPSGPVVIEVNPRLTTSYCGLRQATGLNLAARVLGAIPARRDRSTGRTVLLHLDPVHAR